MNSVKHFTRCVLSAFVFGVGASNLAAPSPGWSKETTEKYWAYIAEISLRASTAPRFEEADAEAGEGILEAFGTKYMPNAYMFYQEKREKAKEREAMLCETFPNGRKSDITGGKLYDKIKRSVAKAVSEMDRRHDELCYYYLLHKIGVITDEELSKFDSMPICVMLPSMNDAKDIPSYEGTVKSLTTTERTFAGKYLPNMLSGYDCLLNVFSEGKKAYSVIRSEMIMIDATRSNSILMRLISHLDMVRDSLNTLADMVKTQNLLYAAEEVTSDQLAKIDNAKGLEIQRVQRNCAVRSFVLNTMGKTWDDELLREAYWNAPLVALPFTMVRIPGKAYAVCKFEVTSRLWNSIMYGTPYNRYSSEYSTLEERNRRYNYPEERITWDRSAEFVKKLNALPEVKATGYVYRIPTRDEWMYACKAGARGDYCIASGGREITEGTLDEVAWHLKSVGAGSRTVGLKKPNAFGLYDMLGNVTEWCTDTMWVKADIHHWLSDTNYDGFRQTSLGGSAFTTAKECTASFQKVEEERRREKGRKFGNEERQYIIEYKIEYKGESGMRLVATIARQVIPDADGNAANGAAQNESEEVSRVRKAAEQGNAVAQNGLGYRYELGNGVTQNYAEALKWYRKAADQGNVFAQRSLGYYYLKGIVVAKDHVEAVKWFRKAAEQGHAQAQYDLGLCYANGEGVKKDEAEAVKWYRKAAAKGYKRAKMALERLNRGKR